MKTGQGGRGRNDRPSFVTSEWGGREGNERWNDRSAPEWGGREGVIDIGREVERDTLSEEGGREGEYRKNLVFGVIFFWGGYLVKRLCQLFLCVTVHGCWSFSVINISCQLFLIIIAHGCPKIAENCRISYKAENFWEKKVLLKIFFFTRFGFSKLHYVIEKLRNFWFCLISWSNVDWFLLTIRHFGVLNTPQNWPLIHLNLGWCLWSKEPSKVKSQNLRDPNFPWNCFSRYLDQMSMDYAFL